MSLEQTIYYLEQLFRDSFAEGQTSRELRLTPEEAAWLRTYCPRLECSAAEEEAGEKAWYLLSLNS